jgi:hypothetical protein
MHLTRFLYLVLPNCQMLIELNQLHSIQKDCRQIQRLLIRRFNFIRHKFRDFI